MLLEVGNYELNLLNGHYWVKGERESETRRALNPAELRVLSILMRNKGNVVKVSEVSNLIYRNRIASAASVDITINTLRRFFRDSNSKFHIEAYCNLGYRLKKNI